jgi:hypothetical protein
MPVHLLAATHLVWELLLALTSWATTSLPPAEPAIAAAHSSSIQTAPAAEVTIIIINVVHWYQHNVADTPPATAPRLYMFATAASAASQARMSVALAAALLLILIALFMLLLLLPLLLLLLPLLPLLLPSADTIDACARFPCVSSPCKDLIGPNSTAGRSCLCPAGKVYQEGVGCIGAMLLLLNMLAGNGHMLAAACCVPRVETSDEFWNAAATCTTKSDGQGHLSRFSKFLRK